MPFINVYKGLFNNIDEICDVVKNSINDNSGEIIREWEPWYELGIRTNFKFSEETKYKNQQDPSFVNDQTKQQYLALKQIRTTLNAAYKNYIDEWCQEEVINQYQNRDGYWEDWKNVFGDFVTNWNFENVVDNNSDNPDGWISSAIEALRHYKDTTTPFAINYHLDAFGSHFSSGPKAIITSTIYLNDDYEGGEVSYLDEFNNLIINYKPQKGDLIVFPSYKPFFHAALPVNKEYKYFLRHFLIWNYSGSEEYKQILSEFGPELMAKFEEYRHKIESSLGYFQKSIYLPGDDLYDRNRYIENGMPFFVKKIIDWNKENQ